MDCIGDIESYGRRRRSVNDTDQFGDNDGENKSYYKVTTTPKTTTISLSLESAVENSLGKPKSNSNNRVPRSTTATKVDLLPEKVDLGLRLTVGEDVNQKPFLPSSQGAGHFPESSPYTEPAINAYYPANNATSGKISTFKFILSTSDYL